MDVLVRPLTTGDPPVISAAFTALGWDRPVAKYLRYLEAQVRGELDVLVAEVEGRVVGYLKVVWTPEYGPFRAEGIPEIQDLNVLPPARRKGVASTLMDAAEARIEPRSAVVGIGVGMDVDYGAAQAMYVRRGYVPDARGLTSHCRHLRWGETVRVDDDLVLYFTKRLRP